MHYEHTQRAPLYLILALVAAAMLVAAYLATELAAQVVLLCSGIFVALLSLAFRQLTVRDEGEQLRIEFGPLPLFRRSIEYANIESVVRSRSTVLDGWGLHLSPGGGWTWNLWGFDCVDVYRRKGSKVRIGTDDPEGLLAFLQLRIKFEQ